MTGSAKDKINSEDHSSKVSLGTVLRRLSPALFPYRYQFLVGALLILTTTGIEIYSPILIGKAVDIATAGSDRRAELFSLCYLFLGLIFVRALFDSYQGYLIQVSGQRVTHELRMLLFARICGLPVPYFDRNPTGRLLTRVINDNKSLSELFTASISVLALDGLVITGTIGAMFYLNWKLALLTLFGFPLVILTIRHYGVQLAIAYRKVRLRLSEINAFLGENVGAIATIQRLSAESARMERFSRIVEDHRKAQMESLRVFAFVQPIANLLNGVSMAALLIGGGYWIIQGDTSVGVVVTFLGYLRNLFQPIRDLVEKYNTFLSSMVSAERIVGILDEKEEADSEVVSAPMGKEPPSIRFEAISFRYPTREGYALRDVDLLIPAKSSVAIVGPTGSGKSTLVRLLLRFYEPTIGEIFINERPISTLSRSELRSQIGVVHQEIYLFKGSLRSNLVLDRKDLNDEWLVHCLEKAQLWELVRLRGGLDMEILEGGTNLSLGERQLLSLTRVLTLDCPVLILDEATSSVDRAIERRLLVAIQEVTRTRTSIVIAHRLSTIQECDRILVMEEGRLIEQGEFEELLRRQGRFFEFYQIHNRLHHDTPAL